MRFVNWGNSWPASAQRLDCLLGHESAVSDDGLAGDEGVLLRAEIENYRGDVAWHAETFERDLLAKDFDLRRSVVLTGQIGFHKAWAHRIDEDAGFGVFERSRAR